MLEVMNRETSGVTPDATLTLPFDRRQHCRLRTRLDKGDEVALRLPRGTVLRDGDLLRAANGLVIQVRAAPEKVSNAAANDPLLVARACYHLGNRHIPVQIGNGWVRYLHDHVLDEMVAALGLNVTVNDLPFEPEGGAYGRHAHPHTHE